MPTMPLNQLASLSEWLALRMAKKNGPAVNFVRKRHPHSARAYALEQFSDSENSISTICLAEVLLYCQRSSPTTAPHSVGSSWHSSGSSQNHGGTRRSRGAILFWLATPRRSMQSTGE